MRVQFQMVLTLLKCDFDQPQFQEMAELMDLTYMTSTKGGHFILFSLEYTSYLRAFSHPSALLCAHNFIRYSNIPVGTGTQHRYQGNKRMKLVHFKRIERRVFTVEQRIEASFQKTKYDCRIYNRIFLVIFSENTN